MSVQTLLRKLDGRHARARAARLATRAVLIFAVLGAVALAGERMGYDLPLLRMPAAPPDRDFASLAFGFLAFSLAGLVQGAVLLLFVLGVGLVLRGLGPYLLRRGARRTAGALDRRLGTDRFSAALEARGALAGLAERCAARTSLPAAVREPAGPTRRQRWLRRLAVLVVLLVALTPGTAPGEEGPAPVAGDPSAGREEEALQLKLLGERRSFRPNEPIPVEVVAEAAHPPVSDLDLVLRLRIDDGDEQPTGVRLFLAAGAPGLDRTSLDLRRFAAELEPGEHRAVALADGMESNPYVFRIEAPGPGEAEPTPEPENEPEPPPGESGGGRQPEYDPKYVEPLIREGEKVEKQARVPIEVPGGGAPVERPLDESWPELERRREEALRRPGLSPHARKLVSEYFERLRPEEGGR
jgi:hypothetical protein